MFTPNRNAPFTFAEIVIGAPWATSILRNSLDNDKAGLLHCNNEVDERSPPSPLADLVQLERDARAARAVMLRDLFVRAARRIRALLRPARAHA